MKYRTFCWFEPAYAGHCSSTRSHGSRAERRSRYHTLKSRWHRGGGGWHSGANFGVRRPLRFLTHRLDLDDNQVRRMATVLNHLKTEREQAQLDEKRTVASLAELLTEGTPTLEQCKTTLSTRVSSAEQLHDETAKAVVAISDLLDDDQRSEFIDLLLAGDFAI